MEDETAGCPGDNGHSDNTQLVYSSEEIVFESSTWCSLLTHYCETNTVILMSAC